MHFWAFPPIVCRRPTTMTKGLTIKGVPGFGKRFGKRRKPGKGLGKKARARLQSLTISYRHPDAPWKGFSATRAPCTGCGRLDKAKKWCRRCKQHGPLPHEERVERWQQAQAAIEDCGSLWEAQLRATGGPMVVRC